MELELEKQNISVNKYVIHFDHIWLTGEEGRTGEDVNMKKGH